MTSCHCAFPELGLVCVHVAETDWILPPFLTAARNLERALGLANTVADERYRLYVEFVSDRDGTEGSGNQIGEYLAQVRLASLAALGQGKNAFGLERK